MLESALALARQGFLVFPIAAGGNSPPLIAEWQRFATSEEAKVRSWWTQWPTANVGVHAANLLILDVDVKKGKPGYESLEALKKEVQLDATLEVETPSGGRHLYYRYAGGVRNGVDVLGPGLDVRSTNGYVVGAGSRTAAGEYKVVVDEEVADASPELVARLGAARTQKPDKSTQVAYDTDADAAVARAIDFLIRHPAAIEGQGGDHHTFATVCRVRDFGVPEERAAEALASWNERCAPPWLAEGLAVKIQNAWRYAQEAPGKLTPEALGFEAVAPTQNGSERTQIEYDRTQNADSDLLHPADVSLDGVLNSEYLIKGVLEKESDAVLFGQWNVGKTFVVLDMAAAIAIGVSWFGKRVRQGRVLYLGYEGIRAMKKRMIALRGKYPQLQDRAVPFEWQPLRHPLTRADGIGALGRVLRFYAARHGGPPNLIIIDPLANALGGDDSDAMLMGSLNECVKTLIAKQRCTVLRVHHSGHGNQERARGHSSLPAGVDTEIRVTDQEIALTKQRDDVRGKFYFKLDVVKLGKDTDGDDVTTCVVLQIEDNALSPELTAPQRGALDAMIKLRGDGERVSKTDLKDCTPGLDMTQRRALTAVLERKQYLRVEDGGWVICERGPMAVFD